MLQIVKLNEDEPSYRLKFLFEREMNPNWKMFYLICSAIKNETPLNQNTLTDYEYFKRIKLNKRNKDELPSTEYILLDDNKPKTILNIIMINEYIADITIITLPSERNKGYAKKGITMIEEILFKNPTIIFTSITDITEAKISSHIALSLGYTYDSETNTFVKANPNLTYDDIAKLNL